MIDVKGNFSRKFGDISCGLCKMNRPQNQEHLFFCDAIIEKCSQLRANTDIFYSDLFKDVNRQIRCVRLMVAILDTKTKLEEL